MCRWLTRNGLVGDDGFITPDKIRILSDPQLAFMSRYSIIQGGSTSTTSIDMDTDDRKSDRGVTATTNNNYRWSMSMLVFDTDGAIVQFERNVDPAHCMELVSKTLQQKYSTS